MTLNIKNSLMTHIHKNRNYLILTLFPISCIIMALLVSDLNSIINGIYKIIVHPDILLTDYIEVGGIGAALFNSAILTLINIFILWIYKIRVTGISISAIFIISGFAFFGKNLFNVWPIYLGGFLYAKQQGKSFKNIAIITMFGTALSPLVNEIAYGLNLPLSLGLIIAIFTGTFVGFIIPPISAHIIKAHQGYNLYNVGFAAGLIGTVVMSFMKSYGFVSNPVNILSTKYDVMLKIFLTSFFVVLIGLGYYINGKSFKGYSDILSYSGRLITDFTNLVGFGLSLINMGIMGLISILYVIISNGTINGPIVGGLLTIVGFASFGKHPKNCLPVMAGVFIAGLFKIWDTNSTTVIISALFGTSLAPISGEYGSIAGIVAGFLHLSVVMNVGSLHGGINLYNNGFSAGIVATLLVPVIDAIKKED